MAASDSVAGVLRFLGIAQAGGSHSYMASRIRREGISTAHFKGGAHGRGSAKLRLKPEDALTLLPEGSRRKMTKHLRRALLDIGRAHVCESCGTDATWQGRPLTLIIDHVNGNWLDNRPANLRFLCPNCHSQTATWCRTKGAVLQGQRETA